MSDFPGVPTSMLIGDWGQMDFDSATSTGTAAAAIHAACYLCYRAIAAEVMTVEEALGDYGLVHGLAHIAAGDAGVSLKPLEDFAKTIETMLANLPVSTA